MSLYIQYMHHCDLCGVLIHKESFVIMQGPDYDHPTPRPNNFRTGTHNWDLCTLCIQPLREVLDARIKELKDAGELNTITHPRQVEHRGHES